MSNPIIHRDDVYNIWSTICDAPLFKEGCTLASLRAYIKQRYGEQGLEELPARLERAHKNGHSAYSGGSLEDLLICNRAGPNETELSFDDFVAQFLTLPEGGSDE